MKIRIFLILINILIINVVLINSKEIRDCLAGESQCSDAAPYTCLVGSAIGGCSSDPNFWPTAGCGQQCKKSDSPTPPTPTDKRSFFVKNNSKINLYVAIIMDPKVSNPLNKGDGGFLLKSGESRTVKVGPIFSSGRIWARSGCKRVQIIGGGMPSVGMPMSLLEECESLNDEDCLLSCQTGNCRAGNDLAGEFECTVSGETPCSVAEFTFPGPGQPDYYDLSNVDGYNVGISVNILGGSNVPNVDPDFNCKSPFCTIDENVKDWCPPELQVKSKDGVHCTSICKALEINHIQQVDDTKVYVVTNGSVKFEGTAKRYLQFLASTPDFLDSQQRGGFMKDRLCCQCGQGGGSCENLEVDVLMDVLLMLIIMVLIIKIENVLLNMNLEKLLQVLTGLLLLLILIMQIFIRLDVLWLIVGNLMIVQVLIYVRVQIMKLFLVNLYKNIKLF